MRQDDHGGAPDRGRLTPAGAFTVLVDGLAAVGTVLIFVLMLIICADVVARNVMGASLPLVSELGALALVMIVYLQLATTIRHDRLARADLLFGPLKQARPRLGALVGAVFDLVALAMLTLVAWSSWLIYLRDLDKGEFIGVTGVATLPTWPFTLLVVTGITVAAAQVLVQLVQSLRATGSAP